MTRTSLRAAAAMAVLAAATLAGATAFAADAPKVSRDVGKNLQDAQKADQAKDFPTALAAIKKAQDVSGRTPYDDFMINQFLMQTEIGLNDMPAASTAAEGAAEYPDIPADQKSGIYHNAVVLALNAKHFDKALKYAKLLAAMTPPPDARTQSIINQAYYFGGDYQASAAAAKTLVDADIAAGRRPARDTLDLLIQSQVKLKDEPGAEDTLEKRIAAYGDPEDWGQMIDITLGTKGLRDLDAVWLGRLLFASGAKVSPQDATIFGQTSSHLTFFGDAVAAQQHGGTGFPDVTAKADADKKTIPKQITDGAKQGGQYNVKLAEALYSYGMYAEAETAAKLAATKGGATDASEAPMVTGQAQVAQGKYDDAIASFGQVSGGGPATPRIARLWTDYAKLKKSPPAPDAAPATAAAH